MKLKHVVVGRVSLVMVFVMSLWAVLFYMALMEEANDEVDDTLQSCSEVIMLKWLSGKEMPLQSNESVNHYYLREVPADYAQQVPAMIFRDEELFMAERVESEPARSLTSIFQTADGKYWQLKVIIPTFEKEDFRQAIVNWMLCLYILMMIVLVSIIIWKYNKHMRPLYKVLHWLEAYQVGRKNPPLDNPTKVEEFIQLNETAQAFVQRSEAVFEQQKVFIGNVSHEMQTPLAISLNRLEMLMDDDALTERQLAELIKTHQTLTHLTRLNKSLLLLFKIDNNQFIEETTVSFRQLVEKYLDDYKEVYMHKHIQVTCQVVSDFTVQMNDMLANMLITNLLKNAFVHNVESGKLRIEIQKEYFSIQNSGVSTPLDSVKIFQRFYQQQKNEGNTGLGLAIADAVCKHSALALEYIYHTGVHEFRISRR
ncbi:MAG: HAMP domain-containing sensor histidine kinase [Phocaeicola sp.]|nr:HAMP domain-containing sensor histidine kinase [Phocaeicola sp.]